MDVKVNPKIASFLKFVMCGYIKVGDEIWSTGTRGEKKLTKSQIKSIEKTGIVSFDWQEDCIKLQSTVDLVRVSPIGKVPYKTFNVEYNE